jgi:hypothetical protein
MDLQHVDVLAGVSGRRWDELVGTESSQSAEEDVQVAAVCAP